MNRTTVIQDLLDFIADVFYVSELSEIDLDGSLIQQDVIDSMGLVEIAAFIGKKYGFTITEEHLTQANFGSINNIVDFVFANTLEKAV